MPVLEAAWEKGFEVFIANIKENLNLVPLDLKKPFNVRERSVKEIVDSLPKSQCKKKELFPQRAFDGMVFENGDKLVLNGVFMGNACVFFGGIWIFQNPIVLKFQNIFPNIP
ncbi:hypothetical protein HpNP132_11820 [Helicobacter pylori]